MVRKPSAEIANQLSDGLVYLLLSEPNSLFDRTDKHFMSSINDFDGWEPYDAICSTSDYAPTNVKIDCVTAVPLPNNRGWAFTSIRPLSPKHWRGRLHSFPHGSFDFMFRGVRSDDGTAVPLRLPMVRTADHVRIHPDLGKSNTLRRGDVAAIFEQIAEEQLQPSLPLNQTFAAVSTHRKQSYWNVYLGHPGMARSRLATDPRGVRAFFADRDLGEAKRRSALLHWVAGHWRKRRPPNDEDMSWVREHLRGRREFVWNGLKGEVTAPSASAET